MKLQLWIGIIVIIIFIGFIIYFSFKNKENYVLGAMGAYKNIYYKCISDCERGDPSKQLAATHGNPNCEAFCNSMVTEMARQGDASRPTQPYYLPPEIQTTVDKCFELCGDEYTDNGNFCRNQCYCEQEIKDKCSQECQYSKMSTNICIEECSKSYSANCSSNNGWNWK